MNNDPVERPPSAASSNQAMVAQDPKEQSSPHIFTEEEKAAKFQAFLNHTDKQAKDIDAGKPEIVGDVSDAVTASRLETKSTAFDIATLVANLNKEAEARKTRTTACAYKCWWTVDRKIALECSYSKCASFEAAVGGIVVVAEEAGALAKDKVPMQSAVVIVNHNGKSAEIKLPLSACVALVSHDEYTQPILTQFLTKLSHVDELLAMYKSSASESYGGGYAAGTFNAAAASMIGASGTYVGPRGGVYHYSASGHKVYNHR